MRALIVVVAAVTLSLAGIAGCSDGGDPLDGTQWSLSEWTLSSLRPTDFTITVAFSDGTVSGNSGVNHYSGPYEAGSDRSFEVGSLVRTEIGGTEQAMRAEQAYLTLLSQARSYRVAGDRLTLYDAGGNESLVFGKADG